MIAKKTIFHQIKDIGMSLKKKKIIVLNILYILHDKEEIRHSYKTFKI